MMKLPNSLFRQKEGAQREEEAGDRRKGHQTGTPTPAQTLPQVQLGQRCRMGGTGDNMEGGVGFHFTAGAEGARDQSYPLTIRMEGVSER